MKDEKRGRKRKFNPNIPAHINQAKLPDKCYWDNSGAGHWFTSFKDDRGKARRKRIAGRDALLSDLHRLIEEWNGINRDSFAWIADKYMNSDQYIQLADKTKKNHLNSLNTISTYQTRIRKKLSEVSLSYWDDALVQQFVDKIAKVRGPSAARICNQFIRRVFSWCIKRGYVSNNPATRTELPKERKKQVYPTHMAYYALLNYAKKHGTYELKYDGSCAHYIWIVMEIEYLCRLRGVECRNLTDAHVLEEGLLVVRAKGSKGNITLWNDRLKAAIKAAQEARDAIFERNKRPIPLKPENRPLVVNTLGDQIKASTYQSAWKRFITKTIQLGVIKKSERFSLHDLKRKGITDTKGTKSEKMDAGGHREPKMLEIYDKSIPKVKPTTK